VGPRLLTNALLLKLECRRRPVRVDGQRDGRGRGRSAALRLIWPYLWALSEPAVAVVRPAQRAARSSGRRSRLPDSWADANLAEGARTVAKGARLAESRAGAR